MILRSLGAKLLSSTVLMAPEGVGNGSPAGGQSGANSDGKPNGGGNGSNNPGSGTFDPAVVYAELDTDTRSWLQKNEQAWKDPKNLAKHAYNQEKLLGNAIRVPGENATQEEREAYLKKLGRPDKPDDYDFKKPDNLPASLPYNDERAKKLKAEAHKMGLTKSQAQQMHDLYLNEMVGLHNLTVEQQTAVNTKRAADEAAKLVADWGPLDGDKARANLEIADRALTLGGTDNSLVEALKEMGVIDDKKTIYNHKFARWLAKVGAALFGEDKVHKGRADFVGNPFAEGRDFNLTKAMQLAKTDPEHARSLIAAAGKRPGDFGLK